MKRSRKSYNHEFKIAAVRLLNEGAKGLAETARELGVNRTMLARWRKELEKDPESAFPGSGRMKPEEMELRELERQVEELREERAILEKCGGRIPRENGKIYRFIESNHRQFNVRTMCQILGVSRSAFYEWRKRPQSLREQADEKLLPEIHSIHRGAETVSGDRGSESEIMELEIHAPDDQMARWGTLSLDDQSPILGLTAAMEAAGVDERGYGFILRYGRYAADGRRSDFLVGGLGLAELSKRIVAWLEEHGPLDAQVQIVDDGSGELIVYLLAK